MRRTALVAVLTGLALSACTGPESPPEDGSDPAPTSTPSSTAPPVVPPPPPENACYRLTLPELTEPTNGSEPVRCGRGHTSQTIFVGELDLVVDGHAVAVDSRRAQRQVQTACPKRFAAYVGGTPEERDLSRLRVVWFSPTLDQGEAGARWFRCDVVAFGTGDQLHAQRRTIRRGVLSTEAGRSRYGLCGTAAPGTPGFERVLCSMRHRWRALATIPIEGGVRYPGEGVARKAGATTCSDLVREDADYPLKFTYGWEWPTRKQWRAGQRYGYCWAPVP